MVVYRESEEQYFKVGIDLATRKVNAIFVGGRDTLGYKGLRVTCLLKS